MAQEQIDESSVTRWLATRPGWSLRDGKLHKVFAFEDFVAAFAWMTTVGEVAETMNHHPEWLNVYGTVTVWLQTHDADGLTTLDLALADAMDDLRD